MICCRSWGRRECSVLNWGVLWAQVVQVPLEIFQTGALLEVREGFFLVTSC